MPLPWLLCSKSLRRGGLRGLALAGLLFAGAPALACEAPVFAQYRSQPPLLGSTPDSALQVALHANGCVAVRYPQQDRRAGTRHWQLPATRWQALRDQIVASGVAQIDTVAVQRRLQAAADRLAKGELAASGAPLLYVTADENLLDFVLPNDAAGKQLRGLNWTSLHADQLNLPDDPDLARIAALRATFEELATETHRKGTPK